MKTIGICIFEDTTSYRESLEFLIETSDDFELKGSFADTRQLLYRIEQCRPDVVLMDINIKPSNGMEAVVLIKSQFPEIKVCMQTVFDDADKVFASLCSGASGYILKSDAVDRVIAALKEVALGGAFFSASIANKILHHFTAQTVRTELYHLTPREKDTLKLLVEGKSYKEAAAALDVSFDTIHSHIKKIYSKLHVSSKSEAVALALKQKIVQE
jgi:DNA-binding NarL/FixJ family response regulator